MLTGAFTGAAEPIEQLSGEMALVNGSRRGRGHLAAVHSQFVDCIHCSAFPSHSSIRIRGTMLWMFSFRLFG